MKGTGLHGDDCFVDEFDGFGTDDVGADDGAARGAADGSALAGDQLDETFGLADDGGAIDEAHRIGGDVDLVAVPVAGFGLG